MPGENLVLTVDANIQYMAERALDAQMEKTHALHGTVVVQDPHTGQILALAIAPRFNPNDQKHMDASVLQNLAVSDVYEPGSTFKLVTYSAALDGAGVQPTDKVDCQGGSMTMYGRTLHDDKSDHYGVITVQQALEHSSDVGAAKMALKLGSQKFYDYMRSFGFGDRSGIELPSETRGLLRSPKKWGATSILSMAIGQEVGVTPVQLVTHGEHACERWRVHAAACSAGERGCDEGRSAVEAGGVSAEQPAAGGAAGRGAPGDLGDDLGEDAHDDAGHRGGGYGEERGAERIQLGRKDGDGAEDRCGDAHVLAHEAGGELCGVCAGEQPGDCDCGGDGHAAGEEAQRYGGAASAPVFAEVAQQVLEYLGVPHDQPLKTKSELLAEVQKGELEDHPQDEVVDLQAMFADVNSLPADDPLRSPPELAPPAEGADGTSAAMATVSGGNVSGGRGVPGCWTGCRQRCWRRLERTEGRQARCRMRPRVRRRSWPRRR